MSRIDDMMNMGTAVNYRLHADILSIPQLNFLQKEEDYNPQMIFSASGSGYTEQLVAGGQLNANETFEDRIKFEITNTRESMKLNYNIDVNYIPFRQYDNGTFKFKLYFQDMIMPVDNKTQVFRNLLAYFVEPSWNDFYQLSLGAGWFDIPTDILKIGEIDLQNDTITRQLVKGIKILMDNLKYKTT